MFGLKGIDAVKKLNDDFRLNINLKGDFDKTKINELKAKQELERQFKEWAKQIEIALCKIIRTYNTWLKHEQPLTTRHIEALQYIHYFEYLSDFMGKATDEEKISLWKDKKAVSFIAGRQLN
jgi:hypothetical protein